MLPLASVISSGEQLGPNRMAVLLDSDRAGVDKAKKLIDMLVHGHDSVMLMGDIIGIPRAQAEDIVSFDELLRGLKEMGRTPATVPARKAGETNVELLQRLFHENGWGELTHEVKAKVVLHTVDLWRSGTLVPEEETLVRARAVVSAANSAFEKLFASAATPI
jgi:hypothetical protein